MPRLDYALLADFVKAEGGKAHVIGGGVDTITSSGVPTGQTLGLLARLAFTRNECGRDHHIEIIFQDIDGHHLAELSTDLAPEAFEGLPPNWDTGVLIGLNMGIPLPDYGVYAFEILVNDTHMKTLQLRVVEPSE